MDVSNSLFQAVRDGNLSLATEIISTYGLTYSKAWGMGYTLLRTSTKNKHTEITKLLLTSGAKVNNTNNKRKKSNGTPLNFAAQHGHLEIVKLLLEKGANIHAKNEHGATALQTSVFRNKLDVVELLLSRGAAVNDTMKDGLTCLHTSIQKGNLSAVEILLKYKANVNATSYSNQSDGQTPLHFAAKKGNYKIVELLLKNGAIVDAKAEGFALPPIYFAILSKKDKVVKLLLEHGANVDTDDTFGKTILVLAVEHGNLKMVEHILKYGPDLNNKMNNTALNYAINSPESKYKLIVDKLLQYGFTYDVNQKLLHAAIENGYTQIVENCLKNSTNIKINKSYYSLHTAVKKKYFEITKMLIDYGVNVNSIDGNDVTALNHAAFNGDIRIVKLLLQNGASIKKCTNLLLNAVKWQSIEMVNLFLKEKVNVNEADCIGQTALHYSALYELKYCAKKGTTEVTNLMCEIAKVLIAAGADVNAQCKVGSTALNCACFKGYYDMVELLFKYNANMIADDKGELPLHRSADSGNVDILKMLIIKGADVNAKTKDGRTSVHIATQKNRIKFLEYILNHGAKVDEKDNSGSTALHIAAECDKLDFVELLLNYGADIDCEDGGGRTAFIIASNEGNNRIVKALLEYGCDIMKQSKKSFTPSTMLIPEFFEDLFDHLRPYDDDNFFDYDDFDSFSDYSDGSENYYDEFDDYVEYERNSQSINKVLQNYVIMMKTANLEVKDERSEYNCSFSEFRLFKTKCEDEVEKLKSEKICADTNVTFYDIISNPIDSVVLYARNPKILEILSKDNYKKKFPIYCGLIKVKIMKGFKRRDILERGYVFFYLLSDSIRLPYNCIENICSYLGDKDLINLAEASISNN